MSTRSGECSEMSDCSSLEEGREERPRNLLSIRLDRRARRLESNNRERRRMHELNAAFQVRIERKPAGPSALTRS